MLAPIPQRRFFGYVLAAPILVTAAELAAKPTPTAESPSSDVTRLLGLNDIMTAAALPASELISVEFCRDGTVSVAVPVATVGQGLVASMAMLIAKDLAIPRARVRVALAAARPRPVFEKVTGGPDATTSAYTPVRIATAVARQRLLEAASATFGSPIADLRLDAGVITDDAGRSLGIGALATRAASTCTLAVAVKLAPPLTGRRTRP